MLPGMFLDRRRVLMTMAAAGCVLLQTACGGSPKTVEPVALPSKNVGSARPTSTPTTPPNVLADRFVRAYLDEIGRAATSGDTTTLRGMTAPQCPCMAVADYIDNVTRRGSIRDFRYDLHHVRIDNVQEDIVTVSVVYSVPAVSELGGDGAVVARIPQVVRSHKVMTVQRAVEPANWRMLNVATL